MKRINTKVRCLSHEGYLNGQYIYPGEPGYDSAQFEIALVNNPAAVKKKPRKNHWPACHCDICMEKLRR